MQLSFIHSLQGKRKPRKRSPRLGSLPAAISLAVRIRNRRNPRLGASRGKPSAPHIQFGFVPQIRPTPPHQFVFSASPTRSPSPRICARRAQACTKPQPRPLLEKSLHLLSDSAPQPSRQPGSFFRPRPHPEFEHAVLKNAPSERTSVRDSMLRPSGRRRRVTLE